MEVEEKGVQDGRLNEKSQDELYLEKLGYKQELKRNLTSFSNFAVSFSIISVLTGLNSLFLNGLIYGGPVALVYGWILVFFFSLMVGLAMAEIASALPTSGALYYWSAQLSGPLYAPFWSWVCGWMNLIGQVATTASVDYGLATLLLNVIGSLNTSFIPVTWHNFVLFLAILVIHAWMNTAGTNLLKYCADISAYWHLVGVITIIVAVMVGAPSKQSLDFVFTTFHQDESLGLPFSPVYSFLIGLLTAQFTFTGFDASAHMSEETKNASIAGPLGIVSSIVISFLAGLIYIIGLLIAMPSIEEVIKGGGLVVIFKSSCGNAGAVLLSLIVMVAMFFCGLSSLTCNSRMIFAFSRDGAIPFSHIWHQINPKSKSPQHAVWLSAIMAAALAVPSLASPFMPLSSGIPVAFTAVTSISVIGLYISYVIPVFLKNTVGRKSFVKGPFHLGRFSPIIGWISIFWTCFICVIFILPQSYPNPLNVDTFSWFTNFNYTGPMIIVATLLFMGWYFMDAKYWFKGPKIARL